MGGGATVPPVPAPGAGSDPAPSAAGAAGVGGGAGVPAALGVKAVPWPDREWGGAGTRGRRDSGSGAGRWARPGRGGRHLPAWHWWHLARRGGTLCGRRGLSRALQPPRFPPAWAGATRSAPGGRGCPARGAPRRGAGGGLALCPPAGQLPRCAPGAGPSG